MQASAGLRYQVAIIGAGFGGIGMAYYLRQAGIESLVLLEKAQEVGGTWRENTYPGSGCDVPSHLYSFSFEPHYPWHSRYAKQAEILDYARHCAERHGIASHIRHGCEVRQAVFEEAGGYWRLELADGGWIEAEVVVSAVGQLHRPAYPRIPGRDRFTGKAFHSAHWDHGYDLSGKTVAVIGTGASAVQFVPEIVDKVKRLHVFQRSPGWTFPKFEHRFSRLERWLMDRIPLLETLDRLRIFFIAETLAYAYNGHRWLQNVVTAVARLQLRWQVRDPDLRRKLTPDFPVGCKRILLTWNWLPALAHRNTEVVTEAIEEITDNGLRTADGRHREVDVILYGTGFAATEFLTPMRVIGAGGKDLHAQWHEGAEAYLGVAVAGFPNFFMLYGPNTNVGSGSILFMLECQQRYIVRLLQLRRRKRWKAIGVSAAAQAEYSREIQRRSAETTYSGDCQSWYKTADGRNTNNWVGSMIEFRRRTAEPQESDFHGTPAGA